MGEKILNFLVIQNNNMRGRRIFVLKNIYFVIKDLLIFIPFFKDKNQLFHFSFFRICYKENKWDSLTKKKKKKQCFVV